MMGEGPIFDGFEPAEIQQGGFRHLSSLQDGVFHRPKKFLFRSQLNERASRERGSPRLLLNYAKDPAKACPEKYAGLNLLVSGFV